VPGGGAVVARNSPWPPLWAVTGKNMRFSGISSFVLDKWTSFFEKQILNSFYLRDFAPEKGA
jgi:hypothetical protein